MKHDVTIDYNPDGTVTVKRRHVITGVRENMQVAKMDEVDAKRLDGLIDVFMYNASAQGVLEEWYEPES